MGPPFSPNQDRWLRAAFRLFVASVALLGVVGFAWKQWDFDAELGESISQPVPFSHEHHAGVLGISCRYCHNSVDTSAFAGMPDTHTCMTCHSQIWTEAEVLRPVRESYRDGTPLRWRRVHDLADYVYFDHSVHLAHEIDCRICHGEVAAMPQVWKSKKLSMEWCLDCHSHADHALNLDPRGGGELWRTGVEEESNGSVVRHPLKRLENCSVCHR